MRNLVRHVSFASLVAVALLSAACAHEPDVRFRMDAFRAPTGANYVAWTDDGFVVDGDLVAPAGKGCLPESGWPNVILKVWDEPSGYWLFGTRPTMSGEGADELVMNCFVKSDGTTVPGPERLGLLAKDPAPDANYGAGLLLWRQRGQSPFIEKPTPAGLQRIPLSSKAGKCWFRTSRESGYSACVTEEEGTVQISKWSVQPNGYSSLPAAVLDLPASLPPDVRSWVGHSGQLLMSHAGTSSAESRLYVALGESPAWRTPEEGALLPGVVTSVVFDETGVFVLTRGSGERERTLYRFDGDRFEELEIPEKANPTELHLSKDGTLWGTSYGAGWRLISATRQR